MGNTKADLVVGHKGDATETIAIFPTLGGALGSAVPRRTSVHPMSGAPGAQDDERAKRRAARHLISAYHQEQLRILLEHVRSGFAQLDSGEIDEFELDDLIYHYKRSAAGLWKFCELPRNATYAAGSITDLREQGRELDWWEAGATLRNRST